VKAFALTETETEVWAPKMQNAGETEVSRGESASKMFTSSTSCAGADELEFFDAQGLTSRSHSDFMSVEEFGSRQNTGRESRDRSFKNESMSKLQMALNLSDASIFEEKEVFSKICSPVSDEELPVKSTLDGWGMPSVLNTSAVISRNKLEILTAAAQSKEKLQSLRLVKPVKKRNFPYLLNVQTVKAHSAALASIEFNCLSTLMATAGQDHNISIWRVNGTDSIREQLSYYSQQQHIPGEDPRANFHRVNVIGDIVQESLQGHTADILDLAWSKNDFLLSGGYDCTVRLWHPDYDHCLRVFQQSHFITSVCFHPEDENAFVCGGGGPTLKIWEIFPKEEIQQEIETKETVTRIEFSKTGKILVVGTLRGQCLVYDVFRPKASSIRCRSKKAFVVKRSKGGESFRVTGIQFPTDRQDLVMISTNDSCVRLFSIDHGILRVYQGHRNDSQMRASISADGKFLVTASEGQNIAFWRIRTKARRFFPPKVHTNMSAEIYRVLSDDARISCSAFLQMEAFPWASSEDGRRSPAVDILSGISDAFLSTADSRVRVSDMSVAAVKGSCQDNQAAGLFVISGTSTGEVVVTFNVGERPDLV